MQEREKGGGCRCWGRGVVLYSGSDGSFAMYLLVSLEGMTVLLLTVTTEVCFQLLSTSTGRLLSDLLAHCSKRLWLFPIGFHRQQLFMRQLGMIYSHFTVVTPTGFSRHNKKVITIVAS